MKHSSGHLDIPEGKIYFESAQDLPSVKCPLLIIHGDRDEYGSIEFPEIILNLVNDFLR